MSAFETKTEEAKHYILDLLSDKELHFRSEILLHVKENTNGSFTPTFISNCLSKLQKAGKVNIPQRGVYILADLGKLDSQDNQNNTNNQIEDIVKDTQAQETGINNNVNKGLTFEGESETNAKQENEHENLSLGSDEVSATKGMTQGNESLPKPVLVPVTDLDKNCTDILDRAVLLLTAEARSIDILNMTDSDYKAVRGIKESINRLEELKTYFK